MGAGSDTYFVTCADGNSHFSGVTGAILSILGIGKAIEMGQHIWITVVKSQYQGCGAGIFLVLFCSI